jgi:hypothetical protein
MANTFMVGSVFPSNDANAALLQLWVACRHALALQRGLLAKPGPSDVEHEQFMHTFLAISATWKEAADAFREADKRKCFKAFPPEFDSLLREARSGCDKSDSSSSIYKRVLEPLRNKIGAHFGREQIKAGLTLLSSNSLPLKVGGASFFDSTFPLATALVEKILECQGVAMTDAQREFPNVIKFGDALQKIADAAITIAVQRSNT